MGVTYTPVREMEFGSYFNSRVPDNIALEFFAADEAVAGAIRALAEGSCRKRGSRRSLNSESRASRVRLVLLAGARRMTLQLSGEGRC